MLFAWLIRFNGTLPLEINKSDRLPNKVDQIWRFYGTILGCSFLTTTVYSLYYDYYYFSTGHGKRIKTWPQVFVVFGDQLSSSVTVAVGLTLINSKCYILVDAARLYRKMDNILAITLRQRMHFCLATYIIFFGIFLLVNIYDTIGNVCQLLIYLPTYMVYLPLISLQLLYISSFLDLEDRLRELNNYIYRIFHQSTSTTFVYQNIDIYLQLVCRLFWEMTRIKQSLEKLFGIPVLFLTIHNLLHNIVTPYYVLINILRPENSSYTLLTWIIQAVWLVLHFLNLALIVWPGERFYRQAKRTGQIVASISLLYSHYKTKKKQ